MGEDEEEAGAVDARSIYIGNVSSCFTTLHVPKREGRESVLIPRSHRSIMARRQKRSRRISRHVERSTA